MKVSLVLFALTILMPTGPVSSAQPESHGSPARRIELENLGYQPPKWIDVSNQEIARHPDLLLRDAHSRVTFINDNAFVVYFSQPVDASKEPSEFPQVMEAFFVDSRSGALVFHKAWPTRFRRWFNDSFDTEGRIIPVHGGFLVHSGDRLYLYSDDFVLKRDLLLVGESTWSVRVAPLGRLIQALRINGGEGEAEWLDSRTLQNLRTNAEFPGIQSVSQDGAVVTKLAHCIDVEQIGDAARHLCCRDECSDGHPTFLNGSEILVAGRGFEVLSTKGEVRWKRDADAKAPSNASGGIAERSLNGNRFTYGLTGWSRKATFDGVKLRKGYDTIFVYDSLSHGRVFDTSAKESAAEFDYALSPNGETLIVLNGSAVLVYALPK
jgi:hypothetical protein